MHMTNIDKQHVVTERVLDDRELDCVGGGGQFSVAAALVLTQITGALLFILSRPDQPSYP
jgi:hypothetical protein